MTSRCHRVPAGGIRRPRACRPSRAVLAWLAAQAVRSLRILRQCSRAAHGRDQSEHPPSSRLTRVVFYRARPADADGVAWDVTIRGRIFEREMDSGAARSSATLGRARSAARARQQLLSAAIRAFSSTTNPKTYRRLNRQGLQTCGVARAASSRKRATERGERGDAGVLRFKRSRGWRARKFEGVGICSTRRGLGRLRH